MSNQTNDDYDMNLSWSDDPDDVPSLKNESTDFAGEMSDGVVTDTAEDKAAELSLESIAGEVKTSNEDEDDDDKKTATFGLFKTFSMMVIALAVLIFVSTAWFTMNRNISVSGMDIKTRTIPFELATTGNRIRFRSLVGFADSQYTEGSSEVISGTTYYRTGVDTDNILLRFQGTEEDAAAELEPGGSGDFLFYVIPNETGRLNVDFTFNIRGYYAVIDPTTKEVTNLLDISTLTQAESGLTPAQIAEKQEALNYLKGHIFFFEEEGEPDILSDPYYYKKPIQNNLFPKDFGTVTKNVPQEVHIFWMWPRTLGQITLNSSAKRSGIPIVADGSTDKTKVITIVKNNKNIIFANSSSITDAMIENSGTDENFPILSRGYNDADQDIGSNVDYYLLEVTATPGTDLSNN